MGMTSKKTELDRKCDEWIGKVGQEAECYTGNENKTVIRKRISVCAYKVFMIV